VTILNRYQTGFKIGDAFHVATDVRNTSKLSRLCLLFLLLAMFAAQEAIAYSDFAETSHLSNNFYGLHDRLLEKGLFFEVYYLQDFFWNTRGGLNTKHAGEFPRDLGIYLELDTEKAGLWENGAFKLFFESNHGGSLTNRQIGDYQGASNIDTFGVLDGDRITELWYKHSFFDKKFWIKFGKLYPNNDFSYIEYGLEFLNSSALVAPNISFPVFPHQGLAAVLGAEPVNWFAINFGVYRVSPNKSKQVLHVTNHQQKTMVLIEPTFKYDLFGLPGSLSLGAWRNGHYFNDYNRNSPTDNADVKTNGWYSNIQQMLWRERPELADDKQGIAFFGQFSWVPHDRSEVGRYIGGGFQWIGALPRRDNDILGLGAFSAYFDHTDDFPKRSETAMELFYKFQIFGWMAIKPDIQYIINPGGSENKNAVAIGSRLEIIL